ncbi:unnamed protein product [Gordionus sp. m RMFG-2023]|uniref:galactoside alpha-(1,2)-fucosyltransferase 2-like n=1 Tax=Gordionus sp. m RMFG-2023 TaxID=3053472 RepID=UPI0030E28F37
MSWNFSFLNPKKQPCKRVLVLITISIFIFIIPLFLYEDKLKYPVSITEYYGEYFYKPPPRDIIAWQASGRLGNVMFQWAVVSVLALRTNRTPVLLQERGNTGAVIKLSQFFEMRVEQIDSLELLWRRSNENNQNRMSIVTYQIKGHFDPTLERRIRKQDVRIFFGYPNSYRYFIDDLALAYIKNIFRFRGHIKTKALEELDIIINGYPKSHSKKLIVSSNTCQEGRIKKYEFVGVHIRNGDMAGINGRYEVRFNVKPYINRAIQWFTAYFSGLNKKSNEIPCLEPLFVICGDDLNWTRNYFYRHVGHVVLCRQNHYIIDMALLSYFNYSIITQGTYGWWANFLNLQESHIVLYPSEMSGSYGNFMDYLPQWIGI